MIPDNLILMSAQPHDKYFQWQIEVQIVNFRKFGLSDKMHILVWYPDNIKNKAEGKKVDNIDMMGWIEIGKKYPEVKLYFYKDTGVDLTLYIPQLRPHILSKHFAMYPELSQKVIFYHDSDIIFNYLPDFQKLIEGAVNWVSDTSHYLDYEYLARKEKQGNIPDNEAIKLLCSIGNINIETMQSYTGKTGGAQYILKNINSDFWKDVERQCLEIRTKFTYGKPNSINTKYFKNENEGFQSWCADMWAVNMSLWSRDRVTDITKELDFSWATDSAETYNKKPIFHNAGVSNNASGLFYKGGWIDKSPIGIKHSVKKESASYYYVKAIEDVK